MSTNDTVLILATDWPATPAGSDVFQRAVNFVTRELAKMIVRDGEGVTRFITLRVKGARTRQTRKPSRDRREQHARENELVRWRSKLGPHPVRDGIRMRSGRGEVDVVKLAGKTKITFAVRGGQPTRVGLQTLGAIVSRPEFDLHIFLMPAARLRPLHERSHGRICGV